MILRKPFAFFIKHFRLIHLILTICAIFLIIKTNHILNFFLEYMDFMMSSPGSSVSTDLFGSLLFISIVIIIIGSNLIAFLMKKKGKPILFYIINIVIYILLGIMYIFSYSMIGSLEIGMVEIRTLKLFQDFLSITFILQIISVVALVIRTLGFDIKKFNFDRDLEELNTSSDDNEEVEINLEVDVDQFKRNIRKKVRHFKYVYAENKNILNIVFGVLGFVLIVILYLQIGVYHRVYHQNQNFKTTTYQMNVSSSYAVTTDLNGSVIDPNTTFVLAEIKLKGLSLRDIKFQKARISLQIKDHVFYHKKEYLDEFSDLGTVYSNQKFNNETKTYLFVFQIPNDYKNKRMVLQYKDIDNKTIRIRLKPNHFDHNKSYQYNLGDIISFKNSILKNTIIQINNAKVYEKIKHKYRFCLDQNTCSDSYEYLVPTYTGTYDKALLKIEGKLKLDDKKQIDGVQNMYQFIERYGTFSYIINGKEKKMKTQIKQVKPHKNTNNDTYYIEVDKEMISADHITLHFNIRDKEYNCNVK